MNSIYNSTLYKDDVKNVALNPNLNFSILKNRSILITGATGLIGSFLIDVLMYRNKKFSDNITIFANARTESKLQKRFEIYGIKPYNKKVNENICYIAQDICEPLNINIDFDFIIHSASNTHPLVYANDPIGTINTNFLGLNNLLNHSLNKIPQKIVFLSSVEIYGENNTGKESFDEQDCGYIDCNTLRAGYPESKRLCEALCQAYITKYNYNISIGRLSRVYGPTMLMDDSKALSQFIKNALDDRDIILKSSGEQYFSYIYVADAVSAILKLLIEGANGEAYNISDEESDIKLKDLASIIAKCNNKDVKFDVPSEQETKGFSKATIAILNSNKLKKLGWSANCDIKTGIIRTIKILNEIK